MRRFSAALVFLMLACLGLPGCSSNGIAAILVVYDQDVVLALLALNPGDTGRARNGADITVTGDATIDGTLEAIDGQLKLIVLGDLTINGILRSLHTNPPIPNTAASFRNQVLGICIRVAGKLTFGPNASVRSNGPVIITDTDAQLDRTLDSVYDETDSASGTFPTLVPLDPLDPAFAPQTTSNPPAGRLAQAIPPVVVRGIWDLSGLPGDQPVLLFRLNGGRDLQFNNWTLLPPAAPPGAGANPAPGNPGTGARGGNGMNVNIWNNNGGVSFVGNTTINLSDGGDGGSSQATCSTATGGKGGKSGNLRITASAGIDVNANAVLIINPGRSGDGGSAIVLKGAPGADGCPGAVGDSSTATGGDGGDNKKRIFVRGAVAGVSRIQFGTVAAGDGGNSDATACDGGNGFPCCDGGKGGAAVARGGEGGEASLNLGGFGIQHVGNVEGGDGGDAIAIGGKGGDGGKCAFLIGGAGGDGGAADAQVGNGGNATASGGAGNAMGGDAGNLIGDAASATGGNGGKGGDTVFGLVGPGGAAGTPLVATAGVAGTPGGLVGSAVTIPGTIGPDGNIIPPVVFCVPVLPWVQIGPTINAGRFVGHPLDNPPGTPVGTIDIELVELSLTSGGFQALPGPDHLEVQGPAQVEIELVSMSLTGVPTLPVLSGMDIVPLNAEGIDQINPLEVDLIGPQGQVLRTVQIANVPNNAPVLGAPGGEPIQIPFNNLAEIVAVVVVRVPPLAVLRVLKFTIIDP